MDNPEAQLRSILDRNTRVEAEKAWELSWTRRMTIAVLTYLVAIVFLWMIADTAPLLHALVPVAGYVLSTLSLPWIKRRWIQRYRQ